MAISSRRTTEWAIRPAGLLTRVARGTLPGLLLACAILLPSGDAAKASDSDPGWPPWDYDQARIAADDAAMLPSSRTPSSSTASRSRP